MRLTQEQISAVEQMIREELKSGWITKEQAEILRRYFGVEAGMLGGHIYGKD